MLSHDPLNIGLLTRTYAESHANELLALGADNDWENWTVENLLAERPGKWELSQLARIGDAAAGYAICSTRAEGLHLHHFIMGPAFRNRGIGIRLLEHVSGIALGFGLSAITLKVHLKNSRAIRFYERSGFKSGTSEGGLLWMLAESAAIVRSINLGQVRAESRVSFDSKSYSRGL